MPEIYTCFRMSEYQIREAVRNGVKTVEAVGKATSAGTGCGTCFQEIQRIIDEETK
ncbi:(2Fe-2S)-binding protein [Oceanirhabdus sp. W0125-5]|uniref:(2Fe-2S)-binding protein n=1 Tax=Oceanirhabdus sp. W0125-5 TaxID=2999116 RepID=UPI0022F2BF3A|nr:(2Fe-2S)-binding protein [Oceanirhabdus sp. W0125-5]WBW96720.1 (2Fe-2S)-binding protein [Oceanirhabdus sp. W0125-5]